jgi:hypothetical protein
MKQTKILSITILAMLIVSAIGAAFVNTAVSSPSIVEPKGIDDNVKDVQIDSQMPEPVGGAGSFYSAEAKTPYWNLGDSAIWLRYGSGYLSAWTYFTLSYIGTSVEIWVQNSIKYGAGDPRNGPSTSLVPTALRPTKPTYAMLQYLANQFETNILPVETAFFGAPVFHDGSNAQTPYIVPPAWGITPDYYSEPTGRTVILVSNIKDANYVDYTYPYYVIGSFVSSMVDFYFDRNVVNLDAIGWFHNLGPASVNWGDHYYWPTDILHNHNVLAPYAYDSTLAHEWQHLLHYELCPGDDLYMNEGCSMYSEFLCGYGIDPDYLNSYFATPDNSLTEWGDQGDINILADYGAAALWCIYLSDHYGGPPFISYYFANGGGGAAGIDATLTHFGYVESFFDVFTEWKLANLIRSGTKYNYQTINLNDPEYIPVRQYATSGSSVAEMKGTDFGNTITILGYDTGISMIAPLGSDYIQFTEWGHLVCLFTKVLGGGYLYFDGDDFATLPSPYLWTMTPDGWYSGTGVDLANEFIVGTSYVDPLNPTLTIVTAYDFEDYWDFGFVQVSTDGGKTWTSLENAYTTSDHDPSAHPRVLANLPGLTSYNPDWPDWTTMDFNLSAYTGQNVMIGFHYVTDWATTYNGWWLNSATVSGTPLSLTPAVFPPAASFQVSVVQAVVTGSTTSYSPYDMALTDPENKGMTIASASPPDYVILIVTPIATEGLCDYKFQATNAPLSGFFP